jgi:REP element-mobilizing transposase RayT
VGRRTKRLSGNPIVKENHRTETAHRAVLERTGNLWQRDYFDRLIRDEKHFANCVRYIRRNPEKASLGKDEFILWESQTALAIL